MFAMVAAVELLHYRVTETLWKAAFMPRRDPEKHRCHGDHNTASAAPFCQQTCNLVLANMDRYEILHKVGEGASGEVYKAKQLETGRIVALKKIRIRRLEEGIPKNLLREIKTLEYIEHPHVLHLHEYFPTGSAIVIACEFMITDLSQLIRAAAQRCRPFREAEIKGIFQMLLRGVAAVHDANIMHRDLKPSNVLFAPDGKVKIGDFGLARVHEAQAGDANYSHEVATRWYRAPELLFGARDYGPAVDLWAIGCILVELYNLCPLFPGDNDIDQLYRVVSVLGTPDEAKWPQLKKLPDYNKIMFPAMATVPFEKATPDIPADARRLIARFLTYPPADRLTARAALQDPFFFTKPLPVDPVMLLPLLSSVRGLKDVDKRLILDDCKS